MNLVTLTIDLDTHAIVPKEPSPNQLEYMHERMYDMRKEKWLEAMEEVYKAGIAAATPYQSDHFPDVGNMVWIRCSQQLPEINTPVLGCAIGDARIGAYCRVDCEDSWLWAGHGYFGGRLDDFRNYDADDEYIVDFWMPLPLTPKEQAK